MARSVDEHVVDMQFNNKQFENGIDSSLKSIDKLKKGLNFDNAVDSLSKLERAAGRFSLAGMSDTLDKISGKFSALSIVAITALANITNAAINTGVNMAKSLTIDPITSGFDEYETKMNAIRTILSNTSAKGTTLEDVNEALADLNDYADKTIYNFGQMVDMVGKFSASTGELDSSVSIVKGLSNLAATAGVGNERLQGALYQVSQVGKDDFFQKIDWNSLENAGLATMKFKQDLIAMGKEMGVFKGMEDTLAGLTNGSIAFGKTLEKGWLTSDVFSAVTAMYALDEEMTKTAGEITTFTKLLTVLSESVGSGWATTWENIIGDKDEATKFFTSISDGFNKLIGPSTAARNAATAFWNANGGRDAIIQSLTNVFNGLMSVLRPIGEAFREIFPPITGQVLIDFSKKVLALTTNFKIGKDAAENLKNTFKGFFAILDIGKQIFGGLITALATVVKFLLPVGASVWNVTGSIGKFIVSLDKALKSSDALGNVFKTIGKVVIPIANGIRLVIVSLMNAIASLGDIDTSGIDRFATNVEKGFKPLEGLGKFVQGIAAFFYNLALAVGAAFDILRRFILKSIDTADFSALYDAINSGIFAAILLAIKKFIDSLTGLTKKAGGILGGISGTLDGVSGSLKALQSNLKADTLMKIAISLGILAAALFTIAQIDSKKLTDSLGAITGLFLELFGSMAAFELIMGTKGFAGMFAITTGMILLSTGVLILAAAMKKIGGLNWGEVARGLAGVTGMMVLLIATTKVMSGLSPILIRSGLGLIVFAAGLNVLAIAVERLGKLDSGKLTQGLIGIGILLTELSLFMFATNFNALGMVKATGILIFAAALTVLTSAVNKISGIKPEALLTGLSGLAIILGQIALFTKVMSGAGSLMPTAIGLVVIAEAINLLAQGIVKMAALSWDQVGRGLTVMAGALGAITIAFKLLPKNILLQSIAVMDVAGSITFLAKGLTQMSKLTWTEIARGLVAMAASLGIVLGAFILMGESSIGESTSFLILAFSITVLAGALKTMGGLSLPQLGMGLLTLASAFTLFGVAGLVLSPLIPVLLTLSASLLVFGVAVAAVGAGVLMLGAGLTSVAAAGTAAAVTLTAVITSIGGLIPFIFKQIAQGIVEFATGLANSATAIAQSAAKIAIEVVKALSGVIPSLVSLVGKLLSTLLATLLKYVPSIIDTGMKIVVAFLQGIADHIKDVVTAAIDLIVNFVAGLVIGLPKLIQAAFDLMVAFLNGLADAVEKNAPIVMLAIARLFLAIPKAALKILTLSIVNFFKVGADIVQGLINGIKSMLVSVGTAARELGTAVIDAIKKVLGIHSPSTVARDEIGKMIGLGTADGIDKSTPKAVASSKKMAKAATDAAKETFDKSVKWIEDRKYYNQLTLQEELSAWERLQKRYKEGTEERIKADKEAYRVKQELYKADYQNSMNWIEEKKYYNQLSLLDELAAYERVQKRFAEGTEERKKTDREIYRIQQELYKSDLENFMSAIDDKKYYNELGLTEELALYQSVQQKYKAGTEERKRLDREIYRVEREISDATREYTEQTIQIQENATQKRKDLEDDYYAKVKEVNAKLVQDIQSVTDEYENAVKSRSESLYSAFGLFDEVTQEDADGEKLIANLQTQVDAFRSWRDNISALSAKGVDQALIDELTKMGPQSAAQIDALNKLTEDKLNAYVGLWRTKYYGAREEALTELEGTRVDMIEKIEQLNSEAAIELEEYRAKWQQDLRAVNEDARNQLSVLESTFEEKMHALKSSTEKDVKEMSKNVKTEVKDMSTTVQTDFTNMTQSIQNMMGAPDWSSLGVNVVEGIIKGIKSKSWDLYETVYAMAKETLVYAKKGIDAHSPSKEFAKIGGYAVDGFIIGLNGVSGVISSATNLGTTAMDSLSNAIANVANVVSGDLNLAPTIRPVLDLSNVESGKQTLDGMFASGIDVAGVNGRANSILSGMSSGSSAMDELTATIAKLAASQENQNGSILSLDGLFRGAEFSVRADTDITKIAKAVSQEIFRQQQLNSRGRGIATI